MKKFLPYVFTLFVGCIVGIFLNRHRDLLINAQFIRDHWHFRKKLPDLEKILNSERTMVFLAMGQSNAANYGLGTYIPKKEVYNYYKGNLYHAEEPLLGADGSGCSVWTRLADKLIDSGLYDRVIIVPCAKGSTSVSCWAEGICNEQLVETLNFLKDDKIKLTHVLWLQGETDNFNKTTKQEYKNKLKKIIGLLRKNNVNAHFITSLTSYFPYTSHPYGINQAITAAQYEVAKETKNAFVGPNTDQFNLAFYRHEDVHFTSPGLEKLASAWFNVIKSVN